MEQSYFMDRTARPLDTDLEAALGKHYLLWETIWASVLQENTAQNQACQLRFITIFTG
jgi:hypothetical protein